VTGTPKPGRASADADETSRVFTQEEEAAMKERVKEMKAEKRASRSSRSAREDGESIVLAKLAEMPDSDRRLGERLHKIIRAAAPDLVPRTWYGMPAYSKDGNVLCFFRNAGKFKSRYSTLGFSDEAKLDEGTMWPTEFALTELTSDDERRIAALVKKAVG